MMMKMAESITWNQNQGEVTISEALCTLKYWTIDYLNMKEKDYVSELRPPTGLLFIPRVICETGEPW
jgi:hypothetical protein